MAFIDWKYSFSVNIEKLDSQHKDLIGCINQLFDAMKEGRGKNILGDIISSLIHYTETHFRTEEAYFEQYGYPATESHKAEHAAFVKKVTEFKSELDSGKAILSNDVLQFLKNWLQNHIIGSDKLYSKFLNEKGLR